MSIQANQLPRVTTVPATADVILIDPSTNEGSVANASLIGGGGSSVTVDTALSATSTNPVQNRAIYAAIQAVKTVATTSANGLMSSTDKGRLDTLYADYSSALTALG